MIPLHTHKCIDQQKLCSGSFLGHFQPTFSECSLLMFHSVRRIVFIFSQMNLIVWINVRSARSFLLSVFRFFFSKKYFHSIFITMGFAWRFEVLYCRDNCFFFLIFILRCRCAAVVGSFFVYSFRSLFLFFCQWNVTEYTIYTSTSVQLFTIMGLWIRAIASRWAKLLLKFNVLTQNEKREREWVRENVKNEDDDKISEY